MWGGAGGASRAGWERPGAPAGGGTAAGGGPWPATPPPEEQPRRGVVSPLSTELSRGLDVIHPSQRGAPWPAGGQGDSWQFVKLVACNSPWLDWRAVM